MPTLLLDAFLCGLVILQVVKAHHTDAGPLNTSLFNSKRSNLFIVLMRDSVIYFMVYVRDEISPICLLAQLSDQDMHHIPYLSSFYDSCSGMDSLVLTLCDICWYKSSLTSWAFPSVTRWSSLQFYVEGWWWIFVRYLLSLNLHSKLLRLNGTESLQAHSRNRNIGYTHRWAHWLSFQWLDSRKDEQPCILGKEVKCQSNQNITVVVRCLVHYNYHFPVEPIGPRRHICWDRLTGNHSTEPGWTFDIRSSSNTHVMRYKEVEDKVQAVVRVMIWRVSLNREHLHLFAI